MKVFEQLSNTMKKELNKDKKLNHFQLHRVESLLILKAMIFTVFNFIITNYIYELSNNLMFVESVIYCCQGKRKVGRLFLKEKYSEFASLQNYLNCIIKTLFCSNWSIKPTFKICLFITCRRTNFFILTSSKTRSRLKCYFLCIFLVKDYKYVVKGIGNIFIHLRCLKMEIHWTSHIIVRYLWCHNYHENVH